MALPSLTAVGGALKTLTDAVLEDVTTPGARQLHRLLGELTAALARLSPATYAGLAILPDSVIQNCAAVNSEVIEVVMTDTQYADVAALVAAETLEDGDIFRLSQATADLTDNALATAKGSGTADGDLFLYHDSLTSDVLYLGTVPAVA